MPYIMITDKAKAELEKLSNKRKSEGELIRTAIDVASEAIIKASKKELNK